MALQIPITVRASGLGHRSLASRHPKRGIEGVFFYASPLFEEVHHLPPDEQQRTR